MIHDLWWWWWRWLWCQLNIYTNNLYADDDARSMTPSRNTSEHTLVPRTVIYFLNKIRSQRESDQTTRIGDSIPAAPQTGLTLKTFQNLLWTSLNKWPVMERLDLENYVKPLIELASLISTSACPDRCEVYAACSLHNLRINSFTPPQPAVALNPRIPPSPFLAIIQLNHLSKSSCPTHRWRCTRCTSSCFPCNPEMHWRPNLTSVCN